MNGLIGTDQAEPLLPLQYSAAAYLSYAHNPLVFIYGDGTYEPVVNHQLMLEVAGAVGIVRLVDVGVSVPVALYQGGDDSAGFGKLSGAALGDLRLMPRVHLLSERSFGFGLSLVPELTFPTGDKDRFVGDPSVAFRPKVIAAIPFGAVRVIGSVSYRLRRNADAAGVTLGDEMDLHAGADVSLERLQLPLSALAELSASTAAAHPFRGDGLSSIEALFGARTRAFADFVVTGGVGIGLTRGLGTPAFRFILGIAWAPLPPDTDGDGIPDPIDACPNQAEDFEGYQDEDGCPEGGQKAPTEVIPEPPLVEKPPVTDRDGDGIPDDIDRCPDDAEDIDGYQDDDGCPEGGIPKTEYIREERIDIKDTVLFETNKSTIKDESKLLLNQVAHQIVAHPEIKKLRVDGHTDSRGSAEDNLYLSQDRADAVRRYLISRGVPKEVLSAEGFGLTRPVDTNATAAGRAHNRRVEFVILETE